MEEAEKAYRRVESSEGNIKYRDSDKNDKLGRVSMA
jgi:hypothetical protein